LTGDEQAKQGQRRAIILTAASLFTLVVVIVAVTVGTSGGGSTSDAPEQCVAAWNSAPPAKAFGAHDYSLGHDYRAAWVTRLDPSGLVESEAGLCAVVFPRQTIDLEAFAAGQILRDGTWVSFTALPRITAQRIAALQKQAIDEANAELVGDGTLQPN